MFLAVTARAGFIPGDVNFFLYAENSFFEIKFENVLQAGTSSWAICASSTTTKTKQVTKAKHLKNVIVI